MCQFTGCTTPHTRIWRCNACGMEFLVCDVHSGPDRCPHAQQHGDAGFHYVSLQPAPDPPSTSPTPMVLQNLVDNRNQTQSDPTSNDVQPVDQSTTSCSQTQPQLAWCAAPADLALPVEVCPQQTVVLGHSFGAMAERERYLREASGIKVAHGAASGPNNALCELRLLLVNERCEAIQIAVRLLDQDGRHLLFRSTGGHVLQRDPQDPTRELLRTHDVRVTESAGYDTQETFVHVGCYSFFDAVSDAQDEPRLQTHQQYVLHHEGTYRELVGGSDNAQLFHHSEQAVFKVLYDYPNVVADVLQQVLSNLRHPFLANLTKSIRLAAVAVDIFTTRSACVDCCRAARSIRTASQHFFGQVAKDVGTTLGGRVVVDDSGIRVVRIACAVAFLGCPSSAAKGAPASGIGVVHALPSSDTTQQLLPREPHLVVQRVRVSANSQSARPLLTTGSASRERTAVDIAIQVNRQLLQPLSSSAQIPGVVGGSGLHRGSDRIMLGLFYRQRLDRTKRPSDYALYMDHPEQVIPCLLWLETAIQVAARTAVSKEVLLRTILRNYREFLLNQQGAPAVFDYGYMADLIKRCLRQIAVDKQRELNSLSSEDFIYLAQVAQWLEGKTPEIGEAFLGEIRKEIEEALAENTATGENRALNLAIDFGLMDFYRSKLR